VAKQKAKITLTGCLSYAVGRFRFLKDRPVTSDDAELITYVKTDPRFKVELMEVEEAPAAPASPAKPAPAQEEQPSSESVTEEASASTAKASAKSAPPSKLARKADAKKETANETD